MCIPHIQSVNYIRMYIYEIPLNIKSRYFPTRVTKNHNNYKNKILKNNDLFHLLRGNFHICISIHNSIFYNPPRDFQTQL